MAFGAFIQSDGNKEGSVTSTQLAFPSNNTAGNTIQVSVMVETNGRTVTVTDSQGNTYVQDESHESNTVSPIQVHVCSAHNIAAGANTVTASISGAAATIRLTIFEHEGDMVKDKTAEAHDTTGTDNSVDSGATAATSDADELIFGTMGTEGQTFGITAGSGFSNLEDDGEGGAFDIRHASESKVVAATGTYNATFDINPSQSRCWSAIVVTYKAASAPPPPPSERGRTVTVCG